MSYNQSKTEKNDAFYRKSGRSSSFNQQRGPSGGHGRGSGGQAPASSLNSNRSFSKKSNNAQGGQYRVNPSPVNSTEPNSTYAARTIHNGTHVQPQMHGASDGPVAKASESTAAQRSPRVAQNAPTSQPPPVSSEPTVPTSPAKGDTSKAFPFQFGSIVPGVMNGVAIPARTSSAPPNLDEQKRDQARHDSIKPVPSAPIPTVPKPQQPPRNDAVVTEKTNARDTHLGAKAKKDPQLPALTPASQMQRPSAVPVPGMSMPTPFQQSQQSLQFGGPNPQIQSQGMSSTPMHIPMPMSIPIGNVGQVQQPVFIPGLQPHPMHSHGMMHPSHNLSFAHQMGHQLPHQLGNMGIGTGPPYPQQQGGNFAGPRKTTTVKITHPETHEELRLDKRADGYSDGGSSGARPHPNVPSQSHPVKSIAASQPSNYYPSGSYSSSPPYYQPPGSLPLTSSQITPNTQPPIFNYPVNNGPQNLAFINSSSLSSLPVNKVSTPIPHIAEAPTAERSREVPKVTSSASTGVSVTIKPSAVSAVTDSSLTNSSISGVQNPDTSSEISTQHSKSSEDSSISSLPKQSAASVVTDEKLTVLPTPAVTVDSVSVVTNNEANTREPVSRSNSAKDNQKKSGKIGQSSQDQVSVQSPTAASMQSRAVDSSISDTGVSTPVGSETNHSPAIITEDLLTSEGSVAEVADSLSDHKHDKIDESSEASDLQSADLPEANKETNDSAENACSDSMSHLVSGTKDRPNLEPNKAKTTSKGKKKRKEFLQKADAAGTTSDLYNAYKGPEEKKETGLISESSESECTSEGLKQLSADSAQLDAAVSEKSGQNKAEPDDWEDAADVSTPKLEVDDKSQQDFDGSGSTEKKYSRDFLLKFSEQCITLPEGFVKKSSGGAAEKKRVRRSSAPDPSSDVPPRKQAVKKDVYQVFAEKVRDHKELVSRWAVLQETRVEYFRGKDFVSFLKNHPEVKDILESDRSLETEDIANILLEKNLLVRCDRVVKTLRPGKKKLSTWPAHLEIFPEQAFSENDAFFAWTFVKRHPLWQTLLSFFWPVLTLAICLFPVYPHSCKLLILYSCAGILFLILSLLLIRGTIFGVLYILVGKRIWFFPNILAEEATLRELFRFWPKRIRNLNKQTNKQTKAMDSFASFFDSTPRWNFNTLKNFNQISPRVQNHLKQVYLTLCFAVAAAAVGAYLHVLLNIGGILTAIACLGISVWLLSTPPFEERKRLTLLMAAALFQGASIGPLIDFAIQVDPSIIFSSFVATALAFGCFSGAALVAKRREYLYLGGFVSSGLSILMWLHFASAIFGGSMALFKFELYFGLLVFVGYIVVDTQEIVEKAHFGDLDYVKHALTLFTDLVAVFVRILAIILNSKRAEEEKKKKKRRE